MNFYLCHGISGEKINVGSFELVRIMGVFVVLDEMSTWGYFFIIFKEWQNVQKKILKS